jgi:hypothetical protein
VFAAVTDDRVDRECDDSELPRVAFGNIARSVLDYGQYNSSFTKELLIHYDENGRCLVTLHLLPTSQQKPCSP